MISSSAILDTGATKGHTGVMTFDPTPEQDQALSLFRTGKNMALTALAGTGKTSTLVLLAQDVPQKRVQYVAFNKDIVLDAATKFPKNTSCDTAHRLAMMATRDGLRNRMGGKRQPSFEVAKKLGIRDGIRVTGWDGDSKSFTPGFLASLTMKAVENFCKTADAEPSFKHVPAIPGLDAAQVAGERGSGKLKGAGWEQVAKALVPYMKRAWADLNDDNGTLRFDHMHYLKAWQLTNPTIPADVILFDEAQDASPVMNDVITKQTHAQIVWVGDNYQEIYGWAGAINALASVPAEVTGTLTKSFRFGPAIADQANVVLNMLGSELKVVGHDPVASQVGSVDAPDAILCRTNSRVIQNLFAQLAAGRRVALMGGKAEIASFARAAQKLMDGRRVEHAELAIFENWAEVEEYVEQDAQGGDLALMVKIINEFGVTEILSALERAVDGRAKGVIAGRDYDIAISTAHKAKGREWDSVRLADDFPHENVSDEGLRLLYVAVTRAKLHLDITAVALLGGFGKIEVELDEPIEIEVDAKFRRTTVETPVAVTTPPSQKTLADAARALLEAFTPEEYEQAQAALRDALEAHDAAEGVAS